MGKSKQPSNGNHGNRASSVARADSGRYGPNARPVPKRWPNGPADPVADPASLQNSIFPATMPPDNPVQPDPDATTLSPTPDPYTEVSSFPVPFLGDGALQDPYSDPATQASATWTADFGNTGDSYVTGAMTTNQSDAFAPGTGGFGAGEATPDDCGSQYGPDVIVGDDAEDGGDGGDGDGDDEDDYGDGD
jgi:hypothetical protein